MSRDLNKSFHIHIQPGQGNLHELIDDLARQVVHKNVDEFHANNNRLKKIAALGRAV